MPARPRDIEHAYTALLSVDTEAQREWLHRFGHFTTIYQQGDPLWGGQQLCLLIDESGLVELGIARSTGSAATGLRQLRYTRELELPGISVEDFVAALPQSLQVKFSERLVSGGRLPPKTREASFDALRHVFPGQRAAIDAVVDSFVGRVGELRGGALQVAAHERDAVGLALDIADFGREPLREALPDGGGSFLQRLGEVESWKIPRSHTTACGSSTLKR